MKHSSKIDFDDVVEIARSLPNVTISTSARGIALKTNGKLFACTATHRSAEPNSLMVRVDAEERELLLATEPDRYYLTDHYRGHPAILVRLEKTDKTALRILLEDAARSRAATRNRGPK